MTQLQRDQLGAKKRRAAIVLLRFSAGWVNKCLGMRNEPLEGGWPPGKHR